MTVAIGIERMAKLIVNDFSCITQAELSLSRLSVLIGPQASGKSVLSKLVYFCNDTLVRRFLALRERRSLAEYKADFAQNFRKWFPPSAWGKENFQISYHASHFEVHIARKRARRGLSDEVNVKFSPFFEEQYSLMLTRLDEGIAAMRARSPKTTYREFEVIWRVEQETVAQFRKGLGPDFFENQTFVPAGRSFFTSMGKAIAAFERGGMFDPMTVEFGRLYAALRERNTIFAQETATSRSARERLMVKLFGGEVKQERDGEYVVAADGRKIPFSALSSGQQELLPLWTVLNMVAANTNSLTYIEEPEAHLFPSAQSTLIEYLAGMVATGQRRMIITTHSPYVLAKINNLLKAGELANVVPKQSLSKLGSIVRKEFQLPPKSVAAFAIKEGVLTPIISDNLIDAEYLDDVSGDIAREFSALLELESAIT